jgi:hypothetical protein
MSSTMRAVARADGRDGEIDLEEIERLRGPGRTFLGGSIAVEGAEVSLAHLFPVPEFFSVDKSTSCPSWLLMTILEDRLGTNVLALVLSRGAPEPGRFPGVEVDGVGGGEFRPPMLLVWEWEAVS